MSVVFNVTYTLSKPKNNWSNFQKNIWENERKFYNLSADYNYVSYSLNGKKTQTNKDYLTYMEKSTGAFNFDGEITEKKLDEIKEKLKTTKSIIWHGFISFDEDTSVSFDNTEKCRKFLKQTLPTLFEQSHLNFDNVELFASLHKDTNHRHIHFEFFEKEPKRKNKNGEKVFTNKGAFKQIAIDNFMISSHLYFEKNKEELHLARNKALNRLKEIIPTFSKATDIQKSLYDLTLKLPKTNRLQYNSKNLDGIRKDIDNVVNQIISSDTKLSLFVKSMYSEIKKREDVAREIAKENKMFYIDKQRINANEIEKELKEKGELVNTKFDLQKNFNCIEKIKKDFKARLGQIVINICKNNKISFTKNFKKSTAPNKKGNVARIKAKEDRKMIVNNTKKFLSNLELMIGSIKTDFTNNLKQVEFEIKRDRENLLYEKQ